MSSWHDWPVLRIVIALSLVASPALAQPTLDTTCTGGCYTQTTYNSTSTGNIILNMPVGMPSGDVCTMYFDVPSNSALTIGQPTGWHSIMSSCTPGSGSSNSSAAWYVTTGSDPSTETWTVSTNQTVYAGYIRCYGPHNTNTTTPLDPDVTPACVDGSAATSISPTLGSGSLSQANDLLVLDCTAKIGATTWSGTFSNCFSSPTVFSSSLMSSTTVNVAGWENACSTATAPGAQTCTHSGSGTGMSGVLFALQPAAPTATATATLSATPTATLSATPTISATPTATLSATPSATPTISATPTATLSATPSATPTPGPNAKGGNSIMPEPQQGFVAGPGAAPMMQGGPAQPGLVN